MDSKCYDVIVVGAGLSGLSAAKLLNESGLDVLVVEARDRVGGRTLTITDPKSYLYVDLGGAYVGPTQNRLLRLADLYNIKTYKINSKGDYAFYFHKTLVRSAESFPSYWNPFIWLDMNNLLKTMDRLLEEIPVEAPWDAPKAREWDRMTVQEFFAKTCWTKTCRDFGRSFINTNLAVEPWEISLLWMLWYTKTSGGVKRIWNVDDGAQERKFIDGSMQISECMAKELGSDKLIMKSPVLKMLDRQDCVTIETVLGQQYKAKFVNSGAVAFPNLLDPLNPPLPQAKFVILALSPTLISKIHFNPPLPQSRNLLSQRVPMGAAIKSQVWYSRPFWRDNGCNGSASTIDDIAQNVVDDCRPEDPLFSLVGFTLGDQARKYTNMTTEERKQAICEYFSRVFKSQEAFNPVYYIDHDWLKEEFSGGCYCSTYPPGVMTQVGRAIREPHGHIYFAGTETATEWSGYMDGAVQAGERAAREILHTMGRIKESEILQEEPEHPDYPAADLKYTTVERLAPPVGRALTLLGCSLIGGAAVAGWWIHKNQPEKLAKLLIWIVPE